jgi:hypothetical protein
MLYISKETIIAKYTDKSRYKPEYIYDDVYVDEERIVLSKKNKLEKEIFDRELKAAKRFSVHFNCEVFLLPEGDKQGNAIYHDGFVLIIENSENKYRVYEIKEGKLSLEKNFPLIARRLSSSGN